jgi:hypothetical protein
MGWLPPASRVPTPPRSLATVSPSHLFASKSGDLVSFPLPAALVHSKGKAFVSPVTSLFLEGEGGTSSSASQLSLLPSLFRSLWWVRVGVPPLGFAEAEPSPLACCPPAKFKRKVGARSSDWVLQLLEEFSLFVGLFCDGFEGRLSSLLTNIIASNEGQGAGFRSKVGKKGVRKINGLFSSIN